MNVEAELAERWRLEDTELKLLYNARFLWKRYVDAVMNDTVGSMFAFCIAIKGVSQSSWLVLGWMRL